MKLCKSSAFTDEAIAIEVQQFNQNLAAQLASLPSYLDLSPAEIREWEKQGNAEKTSFATERYISGLSGQHQIKLRQFIPETIKGVYLPVKRGSN